MENTITKDMLDNWHMEHGEDFVDYHESMFNGLICFGFFLAKFPERAKEMVENFNEVYTHPIVGGKYSVQDLQGLFQTTDDGGEEEDTLFYPTLIEYMNLCSDKKKQEYIKALLDEEEEEHAI